MGMGIFVSIGADIVGICVLVGVTVRAYYIFRISGSFYQTCMAISLGQAKELT